MVIERNICLWVQRFSFLKIPLEFYSIRFVIIVSINGNDSSRKRVQFSLFRFTQLKLKPDLVRKFYFITSKNAAIL